MATHAVVVTQKHSNGDLTVAGIGRWTTGPDFDSWCVPDSFMFPYPSTQCLRGYQDIESSEKYNAWYVNTVIQSDVTNHHNFPITQTTNTLTSQLQPTTQGSIIKIDLLDAPGNYSGTVQFKDPWLIDSADAAHNNKPLNRGMNALYKSRTAPFSPNIGTNYNGDVYKGVFLNQNTQFQQGIPNYSVSEPLTQTNINGFTGYFQGWTASGATLADSTKDTTAVVFNNAGATVTAKYKAHLGSSLSTATATVNNGAAASNQRKVASDNSDTFLHSVYCSSGSIWYTHEITEGGTWTPEVKLGDGRNPSITVTNSNTIHVVWENYTDQSHTYSRVYYCRSTNCGQSWGSTTSFNGLEISGGLDATPIVIGDYGALVVWRFGQSGSGGLSRVFEPNGANFRRQLVNDFSAQLPSGSEIGYTTTPPVSPEMYHLVFQSGSGVIKYHILYVNSDIDSCSFIPITLSSAVPSPASGNTNPTIVNDQSPSPSLTVGVAWENSANHRIYYIESSNGGNSNSWGTIKEFTHGSDILSQPTLCMSPDMIYMLFQCGNQIGKVRKPNGGSTWSSAIYLGQGIGMQFPSLLIP